MAVVVIEMTEADLQGMTPLVEFDGKIWDWSSVSVADDIHRVTLCNPRSPASFDWPTSPQDEQQ